MVFFRRANDISYASVCVDRAAMNREIAMVNYYSTSFSTRSLQCSRNHILNIEKEL